MAQAAQVLAESTRTTTRAEWHRMTTLWNEDLGPGVSVHHVPLEIGRFVRVTLLGSEGFVTSAQAEYPFEADGSPSVDEDVKINRMTTIDPAYELPQGNDEIEAALDDLARQFGDRVMLVILGSAAEGGSAGTLTWSDTISGDALYEADDPECE